MGRKTASTLLLVLLAVGLQAVLPVLSGKMSVAQPLLAITVVLSLRSGRVGGTLTGASLGALADAMQFSPVGFHGISYGVIGYALSWLGARVLIRSVNPVVLFSLAAYLVDLAAVALLHQLLGLGLPKSLWWWVIPGCLFTGFLALSLELLARKLLPRDRDRF